MKKFIKLLLIGTLVISSMGIASFAKYNMGVKNHEQKNQNSDLKRENRNNTQDSNQNHRKISIQNNQEHMNLPDKSISKDKKKKEWKKEWKSKFKHKQENH